MYIILRLATLIALALHTALASSKPACDSSVADRFIQEIDQFNNLLANYASVVSSSPTSSRLDFKKNGKLLEKRSVKTTASAKIHAPAAGTTAKLVNNEQHAKPVTAKKVDVTTKSSVSAHVLSSHTQPSVHSTSKTVSLLSTYVPVEEVRHEEQLRQSFEALSRQQTMLDSMSGTCVPNSHKEKVVSGFSKMFSLYLVHAKALGTMNHLVARAHQPAGWLTMGNDVNSGYNGDNYELTQVTTTQSSSTLYPYGYGYPEYPGYPPPQYSPQYVTITVSPSTVDAPTSTDSSDGGDDSSDGDDSSSDDTPAATVAPPPAPTAKHHGLLYESTIGLLMGSIHLVERVLGIGGSRNIVEASSIGSLEDLVSEVTKQYKVKA